MNNKNNEVHPLHVLTKVLEKVKDNADGLFVTIFYFSKLRTNNKLTHQLNGYKQMLEKIFINNKGKGFIHKSGDLILFLRSKNQFEIERNISIFKTKLPEDPFFKESRTKFYKIYNLKADYDNCLSNIEEYLSDESSDFSLVSDSLLSDVDVGEDVTREINLQIINYEKITEIVHTLHGAELNNFVTKQSIIWANSLDDFKEISVEYYIFSKAFEKFFDIKNIFSSNPWFFKHLTLQFDRKMITYLGYMVSKIYEPISININLNSVNAITSHFYRFLDLVNSKECRLIVEIDKLDLINSYSNFSYSIKNLKNKNVEVCLDRIEYNDLIFLNFDLLNVDFIKLSWSLDYLEKNNELNEKVIIPKLKKIIELFGSDKIIFARCDCTKAIEFGLSLGIKQFQGFYVDDVMKK